ncbi:MAG: heavy metal translocating P-type ATPase, partial [Roseovarius sp.]|nr:heavy metal translocating P-type ATPase [Roseovarius sp.]
EKALNAHPGVTSARVNLTLKRASIAAAPEVTADDMRALVEGLGYEAHELDPGTLSATATDRAGRALLMRLAVAGFATMNVMLLSVSVWSGAEGPTRDLFHWISAAIALPAIAFSGQPFFANAWAALRNRHLNMDVPISLAIALAVITSLWETSLSGAHAYFDAALALTFFLLAGRYLDHRTRAAARSAAEELTALEVPRAARLNTDGAEETVAVAALAAGDLIRVKPGGRMPVDGEIVEGTSEIDRSLLTGETVPVFAGPGRAVSAGEINLTGPLTLRATAVGAETSLHRMADLVAVAESGRSRYTSLADRAAKLYAPGVHILSALAFLGWYVATWDMRTALNIAAAVLIITCPCALGLAVPAVTTAASGRLFRRGMLIKHETALERLAQVDTVIFDKTGTLTAGTPEPEDFDRLTPADAALALALARGSAHPLAGAIERAALAAGIEAAEVSGLTEVPGYGTRGFYEGQEVRLGRASWVGATPLDRTATFLDRGDGSTVALAFADRLREGAKEAVSALQASGKDVRLMSGDSATAVEALANRLGIGNWTAEMLPADKAARVAALA